MNLQDMIYEAPVAHHFCGKLDGYAAAIIETPNNANGSHAVILVGAGKLHQFPIMPANEARATYRDLVARLNAASVS